jgi:hypothetical protein
MPRELMVQALLLLLLPPLLPLGEREEARVGSVLYVVNHIPHFSALLLDFHQRTRRRKRTRRLISLKVILLL